MKCKLHIIVIALFLAGVCKIEAQVGINVTPSKGVLHIDPKGDTNGTTNVNDDIIILDNARLGIGTVDPTANLDLRGKLRIADGTEGDYKILLSDKDGVASWGVKGLETIQGRIPVGLPSVDGGPWTTAPKYVGVNITLPKGSWIVYFQVNYKSWPTLGGNIWWDLSSSATTRNGVGGRCLSNYAYPNSICSTNAVYFLSLTATSTYYVWGTAANLSAGQYMSYVGNAQIYAIQVN